MCNVDSNSNYEDQKRTACEDVLLTKRDDIIDLETKSTALSIFRSDGTQGITKDSSRKLNGLLKRRKEKRRGKRERERKKGGRFLSFSRPHGRIER